MNSLPIKSIKSIRIVILNHLSIDKISKKKKNSNLEIESLCDAKL
jgi:hypothetical protein